MHASGLCWLGISASLLNSVIAPMSQNLMRHSGCALRVAGLGLRCCTFILGVAETVLLPQVIATQLSAIGTFMSIVFAWVILGEKPTFALFIVSVTITVINAVDLVLVPIAPTSLTTFEQWFAAVLRPETHIIVFYLLFFGVILCSAPSFWTPMY